MRTLIIHNPKSGFGSDAIFQFERSILKDGDECVFRMLDDSFDLEAATEGASAFDVVVASGGDGTVSELLFELRDADVPVCVFPSGTANLLCASLGNSLEPQALARACRIGRTAPIDLGEMIWTSSNGERRSRGFAQMSGTGYDAEIMRAAMPNKAAKGEVAYFQAAIANLKPTVAHFTITVDGETFERDGISCIIANNSMIQGNLEIVPDCRMDDGKLDVIVLEVSEVTQLLRPLAFGIVDRTGKKLGRPYLESFSGREIHVESSEKIPIEIDGDVEDCDVYGFDARVLPEAVGIVVDTLSSYGNVNDAPTQSRFGGTDDIAYPA